MSRRAVSFNDDAGVTKTPSAFRLRVLGLATHPKSMGSHNLRDLKRCLRRSGPLLSPFV